MGSSRSMLAVKFHLICMYLVWWHLLRYPHTVGMEQEPYRMKRYKTVEFWNMKHLKRICIILHVHHWINEKVKSNQSYLVCRNSTIDGAWSVQSLILISWPIFHDANVKKTRTFCTQTYLYRHIQPKQSNIICQLRCPVHIRASSK